MTFAYAVYDLQAGFVDNWLCAGPQAIPAQAAQPYLRLEAQREILKRFREEKSGVNKTPVEPGPLAEAKLKVGAYEGEWAYYRCNEDHWVDHSATYPACHFMRSWAYTQLVSPAAQTASFTINTSGAVDVWVNQQLVMSVEEAGDTAVDHPFAAALQEGENEVLVRFAGVAAPDCLLVFSLQVQAEDVSVRIPTLNPSLERRAELEKIGESVFLDRDVFTIGQKINLNYPADMEKPAYNDVRFQTVSGRIYGQAEDVGKPGQVLFLGSPPSLSEGPYQAFIMPRAWEMYESNIRMVKYLPAWVTGLNRFSEGLSGTLVERKQQALAYVAAKKDTLFSELAQLALGSWDQVDFKVIVRAAEEAGRGEVGSERTLLSLLGALARFGGQPNFERWVKKDLKQCALGFSFEAFAQTRDVAEHPAEATPLIVAASKVLAGQLYPDADFTGVALKGSQLRAQGETEALRWMQARGRYGFANWDSPEVYADTMMALSYLIDFARNEAVWELASVLMDKLFLSLALNSYKGVFGSTRGWSRTLALKSAYLEATSAITRLFWGMGVFNEQLGPLVSLASMRKYELPLVLAEIAASQPDEMWNRERQTADASEVMKATYRTPDFMLCSAQDYYRGQPGQREHVWQATLGPQCVAFVNHPGSASESDLHTPNFWLGNGTLPRVAQWKDALIALYQIPENARLRFTHAYFPTIEFDETAFRGNTAFGRKDHGYIALTALNGFQAIERGRTAKRELRSSGRQAIWLCQMGREALDGDFAAFQEKVLACQVSHEGLAVQWQTVRGDALSFGWEGELTINGQPFAMEKTKHFDNPYTQATLPCLDMEVRTENYLLRLDFNDVE